MCFDERLKDLKKKPFFIVPNKCESKNEFIIEEVKVYYKLLLSLLL